MLDKVLETIWIKRNMYAAVCIQVIYNRSEVINPGHDNSCLLCIAIPRSNTTRGFNTNLPCAIDCVLCYRGAQLHWGPSAVSDWQPCHSYVSECIRRESLLWRLWQKETRLHTSSTHQCSSATNASMYFKIYS